MPQAALRIAILAFAVPGRQGAGRLLRGAAALRVHPARFRERAVRKRRRVLRHNFLVTPSTMSRINQGLDEELDCPAARLWGEPPS